MKTNTQHHHDPRGGPARTNIAKSLFDHKALTLSPSLGKVGAQGRVRRTGGRPKPADDGERAIMRKESGDDDGVTTYGLCDERR